MDTGDATTDVEDPVEFVSTLAAASTLGVSSRTLQRYVRAGTVSPAVTLPSGQYRWDVAALRDQIETLRADTVLTGPEQRSNRRG